MRKRATISAEVVIIGGGLAGLSAAIYLGRAKRDALLIDEGKSMARWEPDVQNYLGFPAGISGEKLLRAGREQARRYGIRFGRDRIRSGKASRGEFKLRGDRYLSLPKTAARHRHISSASGDSARQRVPRPQHFLL